MKNELIHIVLANGGDNLIFRSLMLLAGIGSFVYAVALFIGWRKGESRLLSPGVSPTTIKLDIALFSVFGIAMIWLTIMGWLD